MEFVRGKPAQKVINLPITAVEGTNWGAYIATTTPEITFDVYGSGGGLLFLSEGEWGGCMNGTEGTYPLVLRYSGSEAAQDVSMEIYQCNGSEFETCPAGQRARIGTIPIVFSESAWAHSFGFDFDQQVVALGGIDSVIAAGQFQGTVGYWPLYYTSRGATDVLVMKRDSGTGGRTWDAQLGSPNIDAAAAVETDATGDVYVTGTFSGDFYVGGAFQFTSSNGSSDVFLVKLDGATGGLEWARRIGGTGSDAATDLALDRVSGRVWVGCTFVGTATFATKNSLTSDGGLDCALARYTLANSYDGAVHLGGTGDCNRAGLAWTSGGIYAAGDFTGTIDLVAGDATTRMTSDGATDMYVASYSLAGSLQWKRAHGGSSYGSAGPVGVDAVGQLWVGGSFQSLLGCGAAWDIMSRGGWDIVLLRYTAGGTLLQCLQLGGEGDDYLWGMDIDPVSPTGGVGITGSYTGMDSGYGPPMGYTPYYGDVSLYEEGGYSDVLVAHIDGQGLVDWAEGFGSASDTGPGDLGRAILFDASGAMTMAGRFYGAMDVGVHAISSPGGSNGFIFRIIW